MADNPIGNQVADVLLRGIQLDLSARRWLRRWPGPRRLGRSYDCASLVNPDTTRNIVDAEFRVHFVGGIDQRRVLSLRFVNEWASYFGTADLEAHGHNFDAFWMDLAA